METMICYCFTKVEYNKIDFHDIAEILFKVALNTITLTHNIYKLKYNTSNKSIQINTPGEIQQQ
jgi:hypothetical protein